MAEKLAQYRGKRNFEKTPEPSGNKAGKNDGKKVRFAVQYHIARRVHYDLRLEYRGTLLSWAVPKGPSYNVRDKRLAVKVEDHPLEYAEFEGTIPKGEYGGGTVMLWDEGYYASTSDFDEGLKKGSLKFELYGKRLQGKWALVRMKEAGDGSGDNWLLIKEKDAFDKDDDGISDFVNSVKSGRTAEQISNGMQIKPVKNPVIHAEAQLAKFVETVPKGEDWLYEIKYDGYRIIAYAEAGKVRLMTRNGHDYTDKFKRAATVLESFSAGRAMILDGEMIVFDKEGKSDFQALQTYVKKPGDKKLVYMIFDLLAFDGSDLRELPLIERKNKLEKILIGAPDCLMYSKHIEGKGEAFFEAAAEMRLEGIIGKRAESRYRGDRSGDWIKLKCYRRQEFVIGGYTRTDKKTDGISALLVGVYEGKKLIYTGRVGTGLGGQTVKELQKAFRGLEDKKPPFEKYPTAKSGEEVFWLSPRLVGEVQYAELTGEKVLRQASFKGLRTDKSPENVVMESGESSANKKSATAGKRGLARTGGAKNKAVYSRKAESAHNALPAQKAEFARRQTVADKVSPRRKSANEETVGGVIISSPERTVFEIPRMTKIDVVRYYEKVAARFLSYAEGRVLSVVRCHKGVAEGSFFKKHPTGKNEGEGIVSVKNSEGKAEDYFYIENLSGLISQVQQGTVEFHIWGSRADHLEVPDMMVFDLDPDEGMSLDKVRQGVRDLKSILEELSLKSFLKTSGGKGYHITVPFKPTAEWETFREFARSVAHLMESKWPDRYTSNMRKNKRQGKIFIDWVRNGRGATSVAPYSLRARQGAKVSIPIFWSELDTVAPDGIGPEEAIARIKKADPWKDYFKSEGQLK